MYVQIAFEIPTKQLFDYTVPEQLSEKVAIGKRVLAPFGKRNATGYIICINGSSNHNQVKSIYQVLDEEPVISQDLLSLAGWMASYYFCPLGQVLRTMLPASLKKGLSEKNVLCVKLAGNIPHESFNALEKKAPVQYKVLSHLLSETESTGEYIPVTDLPDDLGATNVVVQHLEKKGFLTVKKERIWRRPVVYSECREKKQIVLTEEQMKACDEVYGKIRKGDFGVCVVHGVTGSGKTEVYIHAIEEALQKGKSVIFLVPEISLTAQTVARVVERFSENVAILHSRLSHGQRFDEWTRIRNQKATIVIGVRSAVFAPVSNLGLIIVDEEHERTYKQEESPRYNARDIAVVRAKITNAVVVLGSATPSLETYNNVKKRKYDMVELTKRVENQKLPNIKVIDMRHEERRVKKRVLFSDYLLRALHERLEKKEQVILFLNRRGYSPFVICSGCGKVLTCVDCSISLVYHHSQEKMRCHYCGFNMDVPHECPECATKLHHYGMGTEKVENRIIRLFPEARVQRMDVDTTQFKDAHIKILERFDKGKIDILIGTQMIAKGLDFPRVTLVGVIFADIALNLPDFRSSEFSFQLLSQVSGRAGRSNLGGEVIIQTNTPDHYAIRCAAQHDYHQFFTREMKYRHYLHYPPEKHFVNIIVRSKNNTFAAQGARLISRIIKKQKNVTIIGPNPAVFSRLKGMSRWQVILSCSNVSGLHDVLTKAMSECEKKWKKTVNVQIDVDPMNLF